MNPHPCMFSHVSLEIIIVTNKPNYHIIVSTKNSTPIGVTAQTSADHVFRPFFRSIKTEKVFCIHETTRSQLQNDICVSQ